MVVDRGDNLLFTDELVGEIIELIGESAVEVVIRLGGTRYRDLTLRRVTPDDPPHRGREKVDLVRLSRIQILAGWSSARFSYISLFQGRCKPFGVLFRQLQQLLRGSLVRPHGSPEKPL